MYTMFSINVFYRFKNKFQIFSHFYFAICKRFQFGLFYILLFGITVKCGQMQNFFVW